MVSESSSLRSVCHSLPPGALAWNADQLSSGSRDRVILQRDIRAPPLQSERRLQGHRQEVCGLKWSTDHQLLASGGNDNKVSRKRFSPVNCTSLSKLFFLNIPQKKLTIHLLFLYLFFSHVCSCLCGTTRVSSRCSSTQSTWLQWRPSPGLPTSTACWPLEAAPPTAAFAFGTLWPASRCSAPTPALRCATWPGPSTPTNWWVTWSHWFGPYSWIHVSVSVFKMQGKVQYSNIQDTVFWVSL